MSLSHTVVELVLKVHVLRQQFRYINYSNPVTVVYSVVFYVWFECMNAF